MSDNNILPFKHKSSRYIVAYVMIFIFLFKSNTVWAQGQDITSVNTASQWLPVGLIILAAVVTIGIWGYWIYSGIRYKQVQKATRSGTALLSLASWLTLIAAQKWMFSHQTNDFTYSLIFGLGYFILPFSLLSLWRIVLMGAKDRLKSILKIRGYRWLFIGSIIAFCLFYLYSSGLIAPPNPKQPLPANGYIEISQQFGLGSYWPSIEFWWPVVNLTGSVSFGMLMLLITLAGFVGISVVTLIFNWRSQSNKKSLKKLSGTTGSGIGAILASSFGCCSPLLPLLIPLIGSTVAEFLSFILTDPSGLPFNALQIGVLSVIAVTAASTVSQRLDIDCQVDII